MLIDAFVATFPSASRMRAVRSGARYLSDRLCAEVTVPMISAWSRGQHYLPGPVGDVMRARVVSLWPGQFDRDGLIAVLESPAYVRREVKK